MMFPTWKRKLLVIALSAGATAIAVVLYEEQRDSEHTSSSVCLSSAGPVHLDRYGRERGTVNSGVECAAAGEPSHSPAALHLP